MGNNIKRLAATFAISIAGIAFISKYEGTKTTSYNDGLNVQTICTGHTKGVTSGMKVSPKQCEIWLKEDTTEAGVAVGKLVKVPITQDQYDALVSFTFNLGAGALQRSTLLKKVNSGMCKEVEQEFLKYNKGRINGKLVVIKGLSIRRQAEANKWLLGCTKDGKIQ